MNIELTEDVIKEIGKECDVSPSRVRAYVVRTMAICRHRKTKEQLREKAHCKMTNYEKIKNMSIDEMAKFLAYEKRAACTGVSAYKCYHCDDCTVCFHKWLESEVEE